MKLFQHFISHVITCEIKTLKLFQNYFKIILYMSVAFVVQFIL